MSDPNTPSITESAPTQQKVSLADISKRYLGSLQRIFDLTAYLTEGTRQVDERTYDDFSTSVRFQPTQKDHLGFDAAKEQAERWLLRALIAESLTVTIPLLEDLRSVCALAQWQGAGGGPESDLKRILGDERQTFMALDNTEKFKHLQNHYAVSSPLSAQVLALIKLHNCLSQRRGIVSEKDVTDAGSLTLKLVSLSLAASGTTPQVGEYTRSFSIGDSIRLEKTDYLNIITTLSVFSNSMMKTVQDWVKKQGVS